MTVEFTYRPIERWPGSLTPSSQRQPNPFRSKFDDTLAVLTREIEHLGARTAVLQLALLEGEIRRDGLPRANSRPSHPGVIVAFETKTLGPLQFATDVFEGRYYGEEGWHANLRAVALGLEALRKVDRYGITRRGEQYTGWQALPPGTPLPAAGRMSVEDAARFLIDHGEWGGVKASVEDLIEQPSAVIAYYREAAKRLHPDVGGDPELFKQLTEARQVLEQFGGAA